MPCEMIIQWECVMVKYAAMAVGAYRSEVNLKRSNLVYNLNIDILQIVLQCNEKMLSISS